MSRRRNRGRAINPGDLQTPEAGAQELEAPESDGLLEERAEDEDEDAPELAPAEVVNESSPRIARARALVPDGGHWAAAWIAGRDAAIDAFSDGIFAGALKAPPMVACRDCWERGRNAAMKVLAGE